MVFRHFQRLHKGKYIDTLLFDIFENLRRWPHVANICFNSLRQWRKFCQKLSLPSRRGRDLESFFQIHVSELKSFVHLFTRTLVRGTQWQDRLLPLQPFPSYKPPGNISPAPVHLSSQLLLKQFWFFLVLLLSCYIFGLICFSLFVQACLSCSPNGSSYIIHNYPCYLQVFKDFLQHCIQSWN